MGLFGEDDGNLPWWATVATAVMTLVGTAATTYFVLKGKWRENRLADARSDAEAGQVRAEAEAKRKQVQDEAEAKRQKEADAQERKKRRDIIAELQEANTMLRAERDEYRDQIHGFRGELQTVTVELAVCKTQLEGCRADHEEQKELNAAMIGALAEHGITVIMPGGGSRPHRALPPSEPHDGGAT